MTHFPQPSTRRLLLAWALLVGLTLTSLTAGLEGWDPTSTAPLGWASLLSILVATAAKAREILRVFLNLRASTPGWRAVMGAFVLVVLAAVLVGRGLLLWLGVAA